MANSLVQQGAQSATFDVAVDVSDSTLPGALTITDWNNLPKGKLRTLLTAAYTAGDPAESDINLFYTAAAEAGFTCDSLFVFEEEGENTGLNSALKTIIDLDGNGYVRVRSLNYQDLPLSYFARLQVAYSASA